MKIAMFIYPDMTTLDLMGPLQTWQTWPNAEFQIIAEQKGIIETDTALSVVATHDFSDSWRSPDILFVPGGASGTVKLLRNQAVLSFLADRGQRAEWVTSVCSGSLVLGAAGLLEGYKATSHWFVRDMLANFGATPVSERWVIDRNRASGGGVTAGIDFGLALMARVCGESIAREAQLGMEYSPQPPFKSGTPEESLPATVEAVKARFAQVL
jgi:cyclohexyl-isocyanide hydratase